MNYFSFVEFLDALFHYFFVVVSKNDRPQLINKDYKQLIDDYSTNVSFTSFPFKTFDVVSYFGWQLYIKLNTTS